MKLSKLEDHVKEEDMQLIHIVKFTHDFDYVNYKFVKIIKYYKDLNILLLADNCGRMLISNLNSGLTIKRCIENENSGKIQELELSNNGQYLIAKFTYALVFYFITPFEVI